MKPIKITMTAFGPYKNREVVDFTELNGHKLFVISGNTGAGKTTIFDAICFALYGDASGEDRNDTRMLRSDFADDEVHTSVEFEFEVKGRTYRVLRQLAHVKAGNKGATGDKYELYETTEGKETPLADRFIVSQVNNKIQGIIGLTKEQFSQIVMLPQGEFRKLLTSETENKEEILRRIFKTHFYKTVTEQLNERRKMAQKHYEERGHERKIHIETIKNSLPEREDSELFTVFSQEFYNTHQVVTGLEAEIEYYDVESKKYQIELNDKSKIVQTFTNELLQSQTINERFELLANRRLFKQNLDQRSVEMKHKETSLGRAEQASHLEIYEKNALEIKQELQSKTIQLTEAESSFNDSVKLQQEAELQFKQEDALISVREILALEIQRLQEFQPTVRELENKKEKLAESYRNLQLLKNKATTLENEVKDKQEKRVHLSSSIKPLEEKVRLLPELLEEISVLREKASALKDFLKYEKELLDAQNKASIEKVSFQKLESELNKLEEGWIQGQASNLAKHLHDGSPCPVCGSEEHPHKAMVTNEVPSKEQLDNKRGEVRLVEQQFYVREAEVNSARQSVEKYNEALKSYGLNAEEANQLYAEISTNGIALSKTIEELKKSRDELAQLKEQYNKLEDELTILSTSHLETINKHSNLNSHYQTERAMYDQSLQSIPEELRSITILEASLIEAIEKKRKLEEKWKLVQSVYQSANEKLATDKARLANAKVTLQEIITKKEKVDREFHDAIEASGFGTVEDYHSSKMNVSAREAVKLELDKYKTDVNTVSVQIKQLEEELADKEMKNLDELKIALAQAEQQLEEIRTHMQKAQNFYEKAMEAKSKILQAEEDVKEVEAELQVIKDLYDVVRGENTKKISFERFLQIEFLEQIIFAANERLKRLSNGQYVLVRSDRLEKRGRQSGLGLDVLDNYTGQFRDVKSLSGGEKFNASLCLALGMADVIQSYEGGISIETMFIDEGFGSLDEESLNKAIDTLIDLQQSGRMIGVISHVQELKQAIPAILEVKKTKEGYSETRFVVS
ncbi:AAA family ATPase [Bacillus suaedaesalsae]|uniref:Nuclease SbcCD subunit C n=1 Tax=Bacillus suaedaesalsae TaxID=2810349 RepID=A0ABS2DLX3_9BACI|nr:SMC family ATPase [Bacillus suaedaesalsae]MBM6619489.1 SMC family ATPase [Bacillus suaedaesalsae]